jgi:predicted amidohydrolase
MSKGLRLALAQLNLTVGAVEENRERILATLRRAKEAGANLFIAPELAISGYPPENYRSKHTLCSNQQWSGTSTIDGRAHRGHPSSVERS